MPRWKDCMTKREAIALGCTVDTTGYPWVAYKGPRFAPTFLVPIRTPRWPKR